MKEPIKIWVECYLEGTSSTVTMDDGAVQRRKWFEGKPFYLVSENPEMGPMGIGIVDAYYSVSTPTTRKCLFFAPSPAGNADFYLTPNGSFTFNGGVPTEPIDLSTYPIETIVPVKSPDYTQNIYILSMLTTRISQSGATVDAGADGGEWLFIEGEEDSQYRNWNPGQ